MTVLPSHLLRAVPLPPTPSSRQLRLRSLAQPLPNPGTLPQQPDQSTGGPTSKKPVIGADDDPDPSQPTSPEITYAPRTCPVCGKLLPGEAVYCSDRCRKKASRNGHGASRTRACVGGARKQLS